MAEVHHKHHMWQLIGVFLVGGLVGYFVGKQAMTAATTPAAPATK